MKLAGKLQLGGPYGGKLRDLSDMMTQTLTTLVLRLLSASDASGMGEKGLISTLTSTALAPCGELVCRIS